MYTTANQHIEAALAKGNKGTSLQDAVIKLRRSRVGSEQLFEIALGELWITAADYFTERNISIAKAQDLEFENKKLKEELVKLRKNHYGD